MNAHGTASAESSAATGAVLVFGPFRLHVGSLQLYRGDEEVRLGGRALALLTALASRPGEILSRSELEAQVWPCTVVEESSLRVHVAALRRVLGEGATGVRYIANVPGRGYSFVASVARGGTIAPAQAPLSAPARAGRVNNLPTSLTRLIGREGVVAALAAALARRRLISIVGHGGIGKTSLALAVAARAEQHFPDGVCFVDLAPMAAAHHVPDAVASALGMPAQADATAVQLESWLGPRRLLLVLDNCEHLLDAVAALAGRLLKRAPDLVVLTTSREPLDAEGEWVHRIQPLAAPPDGEPVDSAGALAYPAVQLLAERAAASLDTFGIDAGNAGLAAALCRRLDGVPLAIEFAASRIGLLGLQGVYTQLGDRLRLLGSGRRTALPRHRTLRALLDWSYELLAPHQQAVLRRCGVFKGGFSLEAAGAVLADASLPAALVHDCLVDLVGKSLVRLDLAQSPPSYSLLEITRVYALELLGRDPACQAVQRRHAEFMLVLVRRGAFAWVNPAHQQWFQSHAAHIGNFRAAFEWCFGPEGDPALGVELLATDYHPMTLFLGETEFRMRARQALDAIAAGIDVNPIYEVRLDNIIKHMGFTEARAAPMASSGTLALATQETDVQARLEALYHLFADHFKGADYLLADRYARQSEATAVHCGGPERLHAGRLRALAAHYLGEHEAAAGYASSLLADDGRHAPLRLSGWISWRLSLEILTARLHWIQGRDAQARALAAECVRNGQAERFPAALSQALCFAAIPIALWQGEDEQAATWLQLLDAHLDAYPQAYFAPWASHLRRVLALRAVPTTPLSGLPGAPDAKLLDHLVSFGAWVYHDRAMARWRQGLVGWNAPELLRIEGELLLRSGGHHAAGAAASKFAQALALAETQGARAWALRAADSLAALRLVGGDGADAAVTRLLLKGPRPA